MIKNEYINVVFAVNEKYIQPCGVAIESLLENCRKPECIRLFLLIGNVKAENIKKIETITSNFKVTTEIIKCNEALYGNLPVYSYYSLEIYGRIIFADKFPKIDKFIYLDSDTLILSDISQLWHTHLDRNIIGAVEFDSLKTEYSDVIKAISFFNSGVLLVDAKQYRKNRILSKILKYITTNRRKLIYADQDALNFVLKDKWVKLDTQWNCEASEYSGNTKCSTIHFIGSGVRKPWHPLCALPAKELYYYYLQQTPWRSVKYNYLIRGVKYWLSFLVNHLSRITKLYGL